MLAPLALATETVVTSQTDPADHFSPRWRPDAQWIAYVRKPDMGAPEIRKIKPNGQGDRVIATVPNLDLESIRWSPVPGADGFYWIAYAAKDSTLAPQDRIFMVADTVLGLPIRRRSGEPGDPIPVNSFAHAKPRFSPDGKFLVFERHALAGSPTAAHYRTYSSIQPLDLPLLDPDIFLVMPERTDYVNNPGAIPEGNRGVLNPVWSPDGAWIAGQRELLTTGSEYKLQRVDFLGHAFGNAQSDDEEGSWDLSTGSAFWPVTSQSFLVSRVDGASGGIWKPLGAAPTMPIAASVILESETDTEIAILPFTPGTGTLLTLNAVRDTAQDWNVPGTAPCNLIVFTRGVNGSREVWMVHENPVLGEFQVSVDATDHNNAEWNPANGLEMVYQKQITGRWRIVKNNLGTTCPIQ